MSYLEMFIPLTMDVFDEYSDDEISERVPTYLKKYSKYDAKDLIEESFKRPAYEETEDYLDLLFFVREYLLKVGNVPKSEMDNGIIALFGALVREEELAEHAR